MSFTKNYLTLQRASFAHVWLFHVQVHKAVH